jgi:hypothetical protein
MDWKDSGSGDFEQAPIGSHVARCVKIIDIGTQRGEYQGKVNIRRQCIIGWELPTELMEGGKPFIGSKFYTASLNEKATLRKDLENWRGKQFTEQELGGFASRTILGKPCMLSVIHSEKGRAKVAGVMAIPRGVSVPEQVNPSVYFSLDQFDGEVFESLPEGFRKMVAASPEYQHMRQSGGSSGVADLDDDIPF